MAIGDSPRSRLPPATGVEIVWNGSAPPRISRALFVREQDRPQERGVLGLEADERAETEILAGALLEPERRPWAMEQARGQLDRALETSFSDSAAASLRLKSSSALAISRVLGPMRLETLCLVEPRVLDRDGGVPAEHLEEAHVVLVELAHAELGDHDCADHARAVAERDGDHRFVHVVRAGNRLRKIAVERVVEQDRLAGARSPARDPLADLAASASTLSSACSSRSPRQATGMRSSPSTT